MDKPEKIKTYDETHQVGILSGKPPTVAQGPRRRAPAFYAGETFGRHIINYPDTERYPNGALPSTRNKIMRRIIRGALKRRFSKVEQGLKLPRAMQAQARELAAEQIKGAEKRAARGRWARRLFTRELAIHQARPGEATRKQRRAYAKLLKKHGQKDAIAQLVDKMARP